MDNINIIFDGPPGPQSGRFVEVEDDNGESIKVGEWIDRGDGTWALRIERKLGRMAKALALIKASPWRAK